MLNIPSNQMQPHWVQERLQLQKDYHDYLMGELLCQCEQAGIAQPIHMLSTTGTTDTVSFRVGNDQPGPSIIVTYRRSDLLPPPPSLF